MNKKKVMLCMTLALAMLCSGCGKDKDKSKETSVTLGEYYGVEVEVESTDVTDDEIKAQVEAYTENLKTKDSDNKTADDGEYVNIDYKGTIDGKEFDGGSKEGAELKLGSKSMITGFEEGIVGMKTGKSKSIKVTFPKTYQSTDLQGKEAIFKIKLNYIYKIPKLTDKLVKEDDTNSYNTIKELKAGIKNNLLDSKEADAANKKKSAVITKVIENAKFGELDADAVKEYADGIKKDLESMASAYGYTFETYLQACGSTQEEFEKYCTKTANFYVQEDLVLDAIADKENIELSDKEYKAQLQTWLNDYGTSYNMTEDQIVESYGGEAKAKERALRTKIQNLLISKAKEKTVKATQTPAPTKEAKKDDKAK